MSGCHLGRNGPDSGCSEWRSAFWRGRREGDCRRGDWRSHSERGDHGGPGKAVGKYVLLHEAGPEPMNVIADAVLTALTAGVIQSEVRGVLMTDELVPLLVEELARGAAVQRRQAPPAEVGWDVRDPGAAQAAYAPCPWGGFGRCVERGQKTALIVGQVAATLRALVLIGVQHGSICVCYDGQDSRRDRVGRMKGRSAAGCAEGTGADQTVPLPIPEGIGPQAIFNPIGAKRVDSRRRVPGCRNPGLCKLRAVSIECASGLLPCGVCETVVPNTGLEAEVLVRGFKPCDFLLLVCGNGWRGVAPVLVHAQRVRVWVTEMG